jgi:hypothetical protein
LEKQDMFVIQMLKSGMPTPPYTGTTTYESIEQVKDVLNSQSTQDTFKACLGTAK